MATQIPLDFRVEPGFGVEDFLVNATNAGAFGMIDSWPDWPAPLVILSGPEGSGKSHLSTIFAAKAGAPVLRPAKVDPAAIPDLAAHAALVLEDADDGSADESSLFHLVNAVCERGHHMLITARSQPDHWGLRIPDLLSRLRLALVIEIGPPDDALFRGLLAKLLHDRQLLVEPTVIEYLTMRSERSYAAARHLVERLDFESLAKGRRITKAIAGEVLGQLGR